MTMLRTVRQLCFCAFVALSPSAARAQAPGAPIVKPVSVTPLADGIRVPVGNGFLRLQIKSPSIVFRQTDAGAALDVPVASLLDADIDFGFEDTAAGVKNGSGGDRVKSTGKLTVPTPDADGEPTST